VGDQAIPLRHELSPATPNPFHGSSEIRFTLSSRANVRIDLFNVLGQQVTRLVDQEIPEGQHRISWSGLDSSGQPAASGIYFYRMETGGFSYTRSFTKVR
jgi:flagellar hook assembly protein FlgD